MRRSFEDTALESRFITEEMGDRSSLRPDIPINLPACQRDEARVLRNKLLDFRLRERSKIAVDETLVDPTLSPRQNQILVPLLSIVEDGKLRAVIRDAVRHSEDELIAERAASTEALLLDVIMSLSHGDKGIPVSEITREFANRHGADYERPITNRYIGSLLRQRLRFRTYKTGGVYVLPMKDEEKLRSLRKKYGVGEEAGKPS
jgi:hypothetical protein